MGRPCPEAVSLGRTALEIVAHRGYPKGCRENTIAACDAAAKAGARWVEVDVQFWESVPVLAHDPQLTGLEDTLEAFGLWLESRPDVTAFVEIKKDCLHLGRETVIRLIDSAMWGRWHPIAFDYEVLRIADRECGWIVCEFTEEIRRDALALAPKWMITNRIFLKPGPVPVGFDWMVYEVGSVRQARDLISRGVRWLETMRYAEIARGLKRGS